MRGYLKILIASGALAAAPAAFAIPTAVQMDPTGGGVYSVFDIITYDWQSSGDMVLKQTLPFAATANGASVTTINAWAANAIVGDTVTFDFYAQARLNDMLNSSNASIKPALMNTSGGTTAPTGAGAFEITGALEAQETARLIDIDTITGDRTIKFTSITGSYRYFLDTSPDSDVASGAGFLDGAMFLSGNITNVSGQFTFLAGNPSQSNGSNLLTNTVTTYLPGYIQTDPASNAPITDTTFDTLVRVASGQTTNADNTHEPAAIDPGDTIGYIPPIPPPVPYTVVAGDIGLKADANGKFSATPGVIPEPGTMVLLGSGLLGLAGLGRRRSKKA